MNELIFNSQKFHIIFFLELRILHKNSFISQSFKNWLPYHPYLQLRHGKIDLNFLVSNDHGALNVKKILDWVIIAINISMCSAVLCLVAQSCLTLCNPMDCGLPGSVVHGDSLGKNIGVGFLSPPPGIFPTQGSNPGFLHCRPILYHLSHQGTQEYWSG